jgi:adenine-specific DNA-methyltransferase
MDDSADLRLPRGDDYESMPKEMLVRILRRRDADPGRRLGLVWERQEIDHETSVLSTLPLATPVPELGVGSLPRRNLILEGDNFEALKLLAMTMRGRFRLILIDPPYNTGSRDFVYKDDYVRPDHAFRQSLWLEFLYRRLLLAKELLAPDGAILVSIDDGNRALLDLLMEQVFPGMRAGSFVWRCRTGGNDTGGARLSVNHEHVLVYAAKGFRFRGLPKTFGMYRFTDAEGRLYRLDNLTGPKDRFERPNSYFPLHDPATDTWYPCSPNRVWAYATKARVPAGKKLRRQTMEDLVAQGLVVFPQGERVETFPTRDALLAAISAGEVPHAAGVPLLWPEMPGLDDWVGRRIGWGTPAYKRYAESLRSDTQPVSSWIRPAAFGQDPEDEGALEFESGYTEEGSSAIQDLFGAKVFTYPKPPSLMRELVRQSAGPDDWVLDFFAGSGTTAQAVMETNLEDGGRRRFVVVSHPELGVRTDGRNLCRDVLRERIARAAVRLGADAACAYAVVEPVDAGAMLHHMTDAQAMLFCALAEGVPFPDAPGPGGALMSGDGRHVAYLRRPDPDLRDRIAALPPGEPLTVYAWATARAEELAGRAAEVVALPLAVQDRLEGLAP